MDPASSTPSLAPVLTQLNLDNQGAVRVLHELLQSKVLEESQVRDAWKSIVQSGPSKQQKEAYTTTQKQSSTKNPKNEKTCRSDRPYRERHIALRIYYDGASYSGLAQNVGSKEDNSVERALFAALQKAKLVQSRETSRYSRCGRTDKGVSAAGQVIAMYLKSAIHIDASSDAEGTKSVPEDALPSNSTDSIALWVPPKKNKSGRQLKQVSEYAYDKILNSLLPPTIRVLGWCPVSADFSARFSAKTRTYRYFFVPRPQLDLNAMRQGLALLVGRHDFRNFCKMNVQEVSNFERCIHSAELVQSQEYPMVAWFEIHGQAFLWHQIRCIASILFLIGRGLEKPNVIAELFNVNQIKGKPSYPLAAEQPLVLHDCSYPNLVMGTSAHNLWFVNCQLEGQWEECVLAMARIRNCINAMTRQPISVKDAIDFLTSKLQQRQKKKKKRKNKTDVAADIQPECPFHDQTLVSWGQVVEWYQKWGCYPEVDGMKDVLHIPLLERSRGTTYEEKIEALQKSEKRRQKYEENIVKKRKTSEEDDAFYEHMLKQGGSGV